MIDTTTQYDRLALAEDALRAAGCTRDVSQACWVLPTRERYKVVLVDFKFVVQKL